MTFEQLALIVDKMTPEQKTCVAQVQINDGIKSLVPFADIKIAEKSLDGDNPSVVFLTLDE